MHFLDLAVIQKTFNKGTCWYPQMTKREQNIFEYKKHYIFSRKKSKYQLDLRIDNQSNYWWNNNHQVLGLYTDDMGGARGIGV